jgi:hypothetical protein
MQGTVVELFGLSNRVLVVRKVGNLIRHSRNKQEDAGLQVK